MEYKVIKPFIYEAKTAEIGDIVKIEALYEQDNFVKRGLVVEYVKAEKPVKAKSKK